MYKLDLVKSDKFYYTAKTDPDIRTFEPHKFLTIKGVGEPAGETFTEAVEALYPVAYSIKKQYKLIGQDFAVPKLEGLWWVNGSRPADEVERSRWHWKLLIRMPDFVENEKVLQAFDECYKKKRLEKIKDVTLEIVVEGKCVQVLHVGPYSTEETTLQRLSDFIQRNGLKVNGVHHEIYLSDPRKTAPERMKTILRQPVR